VKDPQTPIRFSAALARSLLALLAAFAAGSAQDAVPSVREQVLAAMVKASGFMMNTVSNRGGFLWYYSADLSKGWGEVPARKSQIWVQPPSTATVGEMFARAYKVTADVRYREYADRVAGAIIWGQLPSGGWHYFIDFDPAGVPAWNAEASNNFRGWEEFYHYYGNATFDDDTTANAARFLLRLYGATLDAKYRPAVLLALDHVLQSQYPNGAWPQRFPLKPEYSPHGRPDYSVFYTFNDGVAANNINLLWEAYEKLGDQRYLDAARRGMDFYITSQVAAPQAGWAQQYSLDGKPGWGRSYEPPALCTSQTAENIGDLENFYRLTGDKRYLQPIPAALDWLRRSAIAGLPAPYTHSYYYALETNTPLYPHHVVEDGKIARYVMNDVPSNLHAHGGMSRIDVEGLRQAYERLASEPPGKANLQQVAGRQGRSLPAKPSQDEILKLIRSLDERGAWLTDIEFIDTDNYVDNPPLRFRGINTGAFVRNMDVCLRYLSADGAAR
jgi:PelA/Pel-15E family pectate lyase